MKLLDLFSGIGGFSLAAERVWGDELEIVAHCEIEEFPQKILKMHWPDVPLIEDIRNLNGGELGTIDIITGGFPCQPFSVAGKREGSKDDRHLWPEMFRVIQEARPRWVVGENVTGIIHLGLEDVLSDLESQGYETQAFVIPACATGAPHRRDRVWILGYSDEQGLQGHGELFERTSEWIIGQTSKDVADSSSIRRIEGATCRGEIPEETRWAEPDLRDKPQETGEWWFSEPDVGRVANGIPNRVDRIKALGNAIVPQVAEVIFGAIKKIEGP